RRAGAADHDEASRVRVVHGEAGGRIADRGDVDRRALAAHAVAHDLVAGLGDVRAARAAAARPRALGPAARVARLDQLGAADRVHELRRRWVVRLAAGPARIARRDEGRDARVVEVGRVVGGLAAVLGATPRVADHGGAEAGRGVLRDVEAVGLIVL